MRERTALARRLPNLAGRRVRAPSVPGVWGPGFLCVRPRSPLRGPPRTKRAVDGRHRVVRRQQGRR